MRNEVALVWMPGHSGIKGNEAADQLARAGAEAEFTGPEPAVGVPCCVGREIIRDWLRNQHLTSWRSTEGCRQARALLGDSLRGDLAACIVNLSRREAKLVTQILTGHGTLKYHQHKLGLSTSPNCRGCEALEESSLHVLCPAYARARRTLLGAAFLEPQQINGLPIRDLLLFWRTTGLT